MAIWYQTECTTDAWSKALARPFLMPCSAIVLSVWTTTFRPLSLSLNVDRPAYTNRKPHTCCYAHIAVFVPHAIANISNEAIWLSALVRN